MVNAIIIDNEKTSIDCLKKLLVNFYPAINLYAFNSNLMEMLKYLDQLNLVFLNTDLLKYEEYLAIFKNKSANLKIIGFGQNREDAYKAYQIHAVGFLLKPFQIEKTISTIENTCQKIQKDLGMTHPKPFQNKIIGIPTIDGLEYFPIEDIIYCEGLQKCTRIITNKRKDIVSSYNIGEFSKLLIPFGFFQTHKSFLINLAHLKKYHKEGSIHLCNGYAVPVARRRKKEFIDLIPHIQ